MKALIAILALLLTCFSAPTASRISATVTVTNVPVTGNTFTLNSSTRTWTNAHSSTTILTNLVGINASATNLFNNYASYPIGGGIEHVWLNTNQLKFVGAFGGSLSGSITGNWGTLVLSTQSGPSTFTALWPMENMDAATNRTNQGSSLVYGLGIYSTNAFPTNATAISNFITKGAAVGPQHITSELRLSGNLNNGTGRLSVSNLLNYGSAIRSEGSGGNSLQLGSNALARGDLSIAIGNGSVASNTTTMAIGTGAVATNDYSMAIGNGAIAGEGSDALAIGRAATAYGPSTQAIGQGSIADGSAALAIQSEVTGTNSIGIGPTSSVSANTATALGYGATIVHHNSTALGYSATTTTTNQIMLGTSAETVSIPGVLAISGTQTNTTFRGTNVINGRIDFIAGARTGLANGYNSGTVLGTNVYFRISGPTAAYTNAGFSAAVDGTWHKLQFDNPGLSYTILDSSGLEATAANRILTGTGALLNSTNNPVFAELIYDASAARWRVISFR